MSLFILKRVQGFRVLGVAAPFFWIVRSLGLPLKGFGRTFAGPFSSFGSGQVFVYIQIGASGYLRDRETPTLNPASIHSFHCMHHGAKEMMNGELPEPDVIAFNATLPLEGDE